MLADEHQHVLQQMLYKLEPKAAVERYRLYTDVLCRAYDAAWLHMQKHL